MTTHPGLDKAVLQIRKEEVAGPTPVPGLLKRVFLKGNFASLCLSGFDAVQLCGDCRFGCGDA